MVPNRYGVRLPLRVPIAEREDALKTRTLTLAAAALVALLGVLAVAVLPTTVRAGVNSWTPAVASTNVNVSAMALSPSFPCDKTVFMASEGYGVFRTTDGDQPDPIWYPVTNGIADLNVVSLAVSPNYNRCDRLGTGDSTVYAGTRSGML